LTYIASRIPESQIKDLRAAFTKFDKNGDGQLTHQELKEGIQSVPEIKLDVEDIEKAMTVIDSNNNGVIDYTEFIAACMYSQDYSEERQIKQAFMYFDKDNSGTISAEELR
jgi:Ca2+-binding EF-hand superfamily protein